MAAADLPYRPCVGMTVFNKDGQVFVGKRIDGPNEAEGVGKWWQMPQGGIDEGEDLSAAALRELFEETSMESVTEIGATPDWLTYDLPPELVGRAWGGKYRGQKMRFVAFQFFGREDEINIATPGGGQHKAEFVAWRWEKLDRLPALVIPFKRKVYDAVVAEFARLVPPSSASPPASS